MTDRGDSGERSLDALLGEIARAPDIKPASELIGTTVGRYRILSLLGQGGMGVVYLAEDQSLRRNVALKVLPAHVVANGERRARFLREARLAAAATHANIATVHEAGEDGDVVFLAMEHVPGVTLRARLREQRGGLPVGEVMRIGNAICRGLAKAHSAGVVHRDLKPENVIVGEDDVVKILDFGLAKLRETVSSPADIAHAKTESVVGTEEGVVLGTPSYMSPEQAKGQSVDERTDVFSMGVLLYELCTGVKPFERPSTVETLIAIDRDEAKPPSTLNPEVPAELDALVARCLKKAPGDRFASGSTLASEMKRLVSDQASGKTSAVGDRAVTAPTSTSTPTKPGRLVLLGGLVVASAAAIIALRSSTAREGAAVAPPGPTDAATPNLANLAITAHPPPPTSSKEAAYAYATGIQLIRDGAIPEAVQKLQRAAEIDPSLAAAHLRVALYGSWEFPPLNARRRHFAAARGARSSLTERDLALLALTEIVMDEKADMKRAVAEAKAVEARFPRDAEVALLLAMQLGASGDRTGAKAALARALELDPKFVQVFVATYIEELTASDTEGAFRTVSRCLEVSSSTSCLRSRARQYRARGECERFLADARRLNALAPDNTLNRRFLGSALASRGAPVPAIREALRPNDADDSSFNDESNLAQLTGDFTAAEAALLRFEARLPGDTTETKRARATKALLGIHLETGDVRKATAVAASYAARLDGWVGDDVLTARPLVLAVRRRAGLASKEEVTAKRAECMANAGAWTMWSASELWLFCYALPAESAAEAEAALDAMPKPPATQLPIFMVDDALGSRSHAALGKVYLLAGRVDEAIPWLRRATAACTQLDEPIERMHAVAHLGDALERKGDVAGACDAYRTVLDAWSQPKPRSVTRDRSALRFAALSCKR